MLPTSEVVATVFESARGGMLFIDEAYSLIDDTTNVGIEAINAIDAGLDKNNVKSKIGFSV